MMTLRETLQQIDEYDALHTVEEYQRSIIGELLSVGLSFDLEDATLEDKFTTMIQRDVGILSQLSIGKWGGYYDPNNVEHVRQLAEWAIDHKDAEMGYNGQTIVSVVRYESHVAQIRVKVEARVEVDLPLEYIGVLVGLGRLQITTSSVSCAA